MTTDMKHIDMWETRQNGKYKGTSPFVISNDGTIYQHYDPKYYSDMLNISDYDKYAIPIMLENEGWLVKDYSKNVLLTWCGDIYNKNLDLIADVKWRHKKKWAPYTKEQVDSLVWLTNHLINEYDIVRYVPDHNTRIKGVSYEKGVFFRSNYNTKYTDLTPAFNFEDFKNKIENNEKT